MFRVKNQVSRSFPWVQQPKPTKSYVKSIFLGGCETSIFFARSISSELRSQPGFIGLSSRGKSWEKPSRCPLFQPMNWWINPLGNFGLLFLLGNFWISLEKKHCVKVDGEMDMCSQRGLYVGLYAVFGKRQAKQHVQYREKLKASQLTHWRQLTMQCIQYHILAIVLLGQIPWHAEKQNVAFNHFGLCFWIFLMSHFCPWQTCSAKK